MREKSAHHRTCPSITCGHRSPSFADRLDLGVQERFGPLKAQDVADLDVAGGFSGTSGIRRGSWKALQWPKYMIYSICVITMAKMVPSFALMHSKSQRWSHSGWCISRWHGCHGSHAIRVSEVQNVRASEVSAGSASLTGQKNGLLY